MKNFSKLILGILAIMCCNNNSVIANPRDNSVAENSIVPVNHVSISNDLLIGWAVSAIKFAQNDLDINIPNNIVIKSAIDNINDLNLYKVNDTLLSYAKTEAINTSNMLQEHNINIQTNFYLDTLKNIFDNLYKINKLSEELCDNNLRNALVQGDINTLSNILLYFNEKVIKKSIEMAENLDKIKNMSQDQKNKLNEYLLSDKNIFKNFLKNIKNNMSNIPFYNSLNNINFNDQNINSIREIILMIHNNVQNFIGLEECCLQELGIDTATIG